MVLLLFINKSFKPKAYDPFTFQYGSTFIDICYLVLNVRIYNLHSNMVLLLCLKSTSTISTLSLFTFQYGSTFICLQIRIL